MELGLNSFWSTQVLYKKFSDTSLLAELINFAITNKSLSANSEVFGRKGILNFNDPLIEKFKNSEIVPAVQDYLKIHNVDIGNYEMMFKGWITGSSNYYSAGYHNHSGAALSSVFYICCEEKDAGGEIIFHDPRTNANRGYIENFNHLFKPVEFVPQTGDILVFPSFLYHQVNTYFSKLRLAIPVDMFLVN